MMTQVNEETTVRVSTDAGETCMKALRSIVGNAHNDSVRQFAHALDALAEVASTDKDYVNAYVERVSIHTWSATIDLGYVIAEVSATM